ncbi:MAG: aldo/keto reductase [Planctomycetes bacterium]|nr:aldo/keto reductase [Planctomycetota bacterium]
MGFAADRYDTMSYRRCGHSGLKLPAISLGGWQAIGGYRDAELSKRIVFTAFDHGITHFDLANNYGVPAGASETLFGSIIAEMPREELVISSKAGFRMWPGPYGEWGSRKYLIESCEASLARLGVDHVDIFYSHRFDPDTPLEETLGALETLVRQGKTLYVGISNYADPHFSAALDIMRARSWAPITIHQPYYHLLARDAEREVLPTAGTSGVGVIAFCPLGQGLLTDRYLAGIPADSRAAQEGGAWLRSSLTPENLERARRLDVIARRRGQSLAEMSLAWLLKDPRVTSVLIGASSPEQVIRNVGCLKSPPFSAADLADIDVACA